MDTGHGGEGDTDHDGMIARIYEYSDTDILIKAVFSAALTSTFSMLDDEQDRERLQTGLGRASQYCFILGEAFPS